MAKINTLNYQTVASWNGSQDLFVVEQPDGTKVATPAMVKQYVLNDMDEVPTENSNNPVKSGGIFSTMAVPKYDAANRREYYEGGSAFSGNIDSSPTAGSNNAVASGGTKTYVDNAVSQLNDEIAVISSGIENITRKNLSANDENAFLTLAYADILLDMSAYVAEAPKCVTRIFTWFGHDTYVINAYRVHTNWIYSFCFKEGKAYYITYDCTNNSIIVKKSFTLT